jgi:hypothetical protein
MNPDPRRVRAIFAAGLVTLFFAAGTALAEEGASISPAQLVRETVQNETKSSDDHAKFMFCERRATPKGSQTKLVVETRDATAGVLVAINDHPLTPQQRQAENARLERFMNDPAELRKKAKQEKEDADRVLKIMKALPEAFLYEPDGTELGREGVGKPGDELVRLRFRPNPRYNPPSRVEQVLTAMQGILLIDEQQKRIAKIDGTLTRDVGFGWGILGHLDRGGHFLVEQADVGGGHWELSRMDLSITGRALFFKSLSFKSSETYSDFRPAPPNLTFAQGVELLKKHEAELIAEQNGGSGAR